MCVTLSSPFVYRKCTLKDTSPHIYYNTRVITIPQPSMSESVINKLDCKNEKTASPPYGDLICDQVTKWEASIGSTSRPGRCPACESLRLYPGEQYASCWRASAKIDIDSAMPQDVLFLSYEASSTGASTSAQEQPADSY
jgi:hypothetical protein